MASKAEKASNRQIAVFVLIGTMIGAAFPFTAPADESGEPRGEVAAFVSDSFASFTAWLAEGR
jgi:hypothetical protein